MMFRRAGAMRCNYFVLHQRNLQRWMEEEGGKLFLWVPGVWCPQLLGGGQGFRALLDMQRDAQGAVWKLLMASAASIFVCVYIYIYEGIKGSMIVHLNIRSSTEGKGRRCGWGSLRSDWETWKKLALGRQHKCETCVWKLSLAARAVLTWTQALHLSVDLVPLPAEGILTHNHPHLAVASQHTPGLWTSLVFVLLWVVLSLTSQILLL